MEERASFTGRKTIVNVCLTAMGAAILTICAFVTIPAGPVPFTLQTLGVCAFAAVAGAKRGTAAVGVYLLLGLVGVPVFSSFRGGPAALFGPTGGYLIGFLATAWIAGFVSKRRGSLPALAGAMALGVAADYLLGTVWFIAVCMRGAEPVTIGSALAKCVVPFLLPDAAKIALAALLARALRGRLPDV